MESGNNDLKNIQQATANENALWSSWMRGDSSLTNLTPVADDFTFNFTTTFISIPFSLPVMDTPRESLEQSSLEKPDLHANLEKPQSQLPDSDISTAISLDPPNTHASQLQPGSDSHRVALSAPPALNLTDNESSSLNPNTPNLSASKATLVDEKYDNIPKMTVIPPLQYMTSDVSENNIIECYTTISLESDTIDTAAQSTSCNLSPTSNTSGSQSLRRRRSALPQDVNISIRTNNLSPNTHDQSFQFEIAKSTPPYQPYSSYEGAATAIVAQSYTPVTPIEPLHSPFFNESVINHYNYPSKLENVARKQPATTHLPTNPHRQHRSTSAFPLNQRSDSLDVNVNFSGSPTISSVLDSPQTSGFVHRLGGTSTKLTSRPTSPLATAFDAPSPEPESLTASKTHQKSNSENLYLESELQPSVTNDLYVDLENAFKDYQSAVQNIGQKQYLTSKLSLNIKKPIVSTAFGTKSRNTIKRFFPLTLFNINQKTKTSPANETPSTSLNNIHSETAALNQPHPCKRKHINHFFFISYRDASEAQIALILYDELNKLLLNKYGLGHPKGFLDKICLNDAEDFVFGFTHALAHANIVICLISTDSVRRMYYKQSRNEEDNVLREIKLALTRFEKGLCRVLPVYVNCKPDSSRRAGASNTEVDQLLEHLSSFNAVFLNSDKLHEGIQRIGDFVINMFDEGVPLYRHPMCSGRFQRRTPIDSATTNQIHISVDGVVRTGGRLDVLAVFINPFTFMFHFDEQNDQMWTIREGGISRIVNSFPRKGLEELERDATNEDVIVSIVDDQPKVLGIFEGFLITNERVRSTILDSAIAWLNPYTFIVWTDESLWTYDVRHDGYLRIGNDERAVFNAIQGAANTLLHRTNGIPRKKFAISNVMDPRCVGEFETVIITETAIVYWKRRDVSAVFVNPFTFVFHFRTGNDQMWILCDEEGFLQLENNFHCTNEAERLQRIKKRIGGDVSDLFAGSDRNGYLVNLKEQLLENLPVETEWVNPFTFFVFNPEPRLWTFDIRTKRLLEIGSKGNAIFNALQGRTDFQSSIDMKSLQAQSRKKRLFKMNTIKGHVPPDWNDPSLPWPVVFNSLIMTSWKVTKLPLKNFNRLHSSQSFTDINVQLETTEESVKMMNSKFDEGTYRSIYCGIFATTDVRLAVKKFKFNGKMKFQEEVDYAEKQCQYHIFCDVVATYFNDALTRCGLSYSIKYIKAFVGRNCSSKQVLMIENYLENYRNWTAESKEPEILAAFSHWTFVRSIGKFMIVNFEGTMKEVTKSSSQGSVEYNYVLTDPVILFLATTGSSLLDKIKSDRAGDSGMKGKDKFFRAHVCGSICKKLGIAKQK